MITMSSPDLTDVEHEAISPAYAVLRIALWYFVPLWD